MSTQLESFAESSCGAVLTDAEIRRLARERRLISDFLEGSLSGASYDLRLGRECYTRGKTHMLSVEDPSYRLDPGQFIILTSNERLQLPDDIVGRAGLMSRWAQRGLVSLFSPQIDPGFVGLIVVPLFNVGNAPVTLKLGETIFTVEFVRTSRCAETSWTQNHAPLEGIPAMVEVEMARPDISDLTQRVATLENSIESMKSSLDSYQTGRGERFALSSAKAGWIAAAIAFAALIATIVIAILSG